MEVSETLDIAQIVSQYGFPIIAALGLGYFIFYIWKWVTEEVNPVIDESHMTLIALIDRVRMLDNDLIRLKTKLDLILEQQEKQKNEKSKQEKDNTSDTVHTTTVTNKRKSK
jgi:hypothetical protein